MSWRISFLLGAGAVCLAAQMRSWSENLSWTNTASGLFSNPKNWSAGPSSANRVPTADDDVSFLWPDITATVDGTQATRQLMISVPITLLIDGSYAVSEFFAQTGISFTGNGTFSIDRAKSLGGCRFAGVIGQIGFIDLPSGSLSSPSADPFRITDGAKLRSEDGKVAGKVTVDNGAEWEHMGDLYDTLTGGSPVPGALPKISAGGVVRFHRVSLAQAEVDSGGRFYSGESGVVYLNLRNGGAANSDKTVMPYGSATIDGSGSSWAVGNQLTTENSTLAVMNGGLFSADDAVIGLGSAATVTGNGSRFAIGDLLDVQQKVEVSAGGNLSAREVDLGGKSGTFGFLLVTDQGSSAVASLGFFVGDGGSASLNILKGARVEAPSLVAGVAPGGLGNMLIQDAGTALVVARNLGIGDEGEGSITVKQGARVQLDATGALYLGISNSGRGTLRISDANSTFDGRGVVAQIGAAGEGTLQLEEGARFLARGLEIGKQAGSTGVVKVSSITVPSTSLELQNDLVVGVQGGGRLSINADNAGALITAESLFIGRNAPGSVEITGKNAAISLRAGVSVGEGKDGTLGIRQGGHLSIVGNFEVAKTKGILGTVDVEGAGSLIEVEERSNGMIVGVGGVGVMHIRHGGSVRVPGAAIGGGLGGSILVEDTGSTLTVTDDLFVGGLEGFPSGGTLAVSIGGLVQVGRLLCVQRDGILQLGDGAINIGAAQVPPPRVVRVSAGGVLGGDGNLVNIQVVRGLGGRIAPGCSIGTLKIQGNVELLDSSVLELEVAGQSAGSQHDVLSVSGTTTFGGGTIEVHFVDGFAPLKGQGFDLVNVGTNAFGNLPPVTVIGLQTGFHPQLTLDRGVLRLTALNEGVATSQPKLTPQHTKGLLTISWPASSTGFNLQHTTNLLAPNWQTVPNGSNPFTVSSATGNEFFRLFR
jgi:T5SS/PEP-CTERM-associated repeat protein